MGIPFARKGTKKMVTQKSFEFLQNTDFEKLREIMSGYMEPEQADMACVVLGYLASGDKLTVGMLQDAQKGHPSKTGSIVTKLKSAMHTEYVLSIVERRNIRYSYYANLYSRMIKEKDGKSAMDAQKEYESADKSDLNVLRATSGKAARAMTRASLYRGNLLKTAKTVIHTIKKQVSRAMKSPIIGDLRKDYPDLNMDALGILIARKKLKANKSDMELFDLFVRTLVKKP
jgi:hypothetical protein